MNVLLVSIAFPPKNNPEGLQVGKYFKYLVKYESINWDVVTSLSPTLFMQDDPTLEQNSKGVRQFIKVPIIENKYVNFFIRKIAPYLLEIPDSKVSFSWFWKHVIQKLRQKPDVIYSRSFPLSSAVMASKLQAYYKVPWVMHLSDPWVENPIDNRTSKAHYWNESRERAYFTQASIITFTSQKTIEIYTRKYYDLRKKFKLSPNVYDPDDIENTPLLVGNKLRIVYTGGLAGDRSPLPILKVLKKLEQKYSYLHTKLEVIFAGDFDRGNKGLFEKYSCQCVRNLGLITYQEAKKLQQSTHVLLLIDTLFDTPDKALFFPSKLIDYLSVGRRILALTNLGSTSHEVLSAHKVGDTYVHFDHKGITTQIEEYLRNYNENNMSYFKTTKPPYEYNALYCSQRLAKDLKELTMKNPT